MPFRVTFNIYAEGKQAPDFTTTDRVLARIEWEERQRNISKTGIPGLVQEVALLDPSTSAERYLYLVYEVRHLQRKYFNQGRDPEVFKASLAKESVLDKRNAAIRFHLNTHPNFRVDDQKSFAFFEVVEEWRKLWKAYFAYKKQADADRAVIKERAKQCRDFEKQIDAYIRQEIGLL